MSSAEEHREVTDLFMGPPAPAADGTRRCVECRWYRPVEEFDGPSDICDDCQRDLDKQETEVTPT